MRSRRIHLVNPKANSVTTRPIYMKRALYSPLAGLLTLASLIPTDEYEVVLTDENIEPIDFDLKADLVGVSAMTSYVYRGYEIADKFRSRGIPVIMGGVHASFMPQEALQHADAVVIGEAEFVMPKILDDLKQGRVKGIYKSERLHPLTDLPIPRYDLLKSKRYVNRTFVQTSRGCHHGCTFCAEHLMNGLKFRYRPVGAVIREIETCEAKTIALNDADFFGNPGRAAELMKALKGLGVRWQAGVNSRNALDERLLELAAESGCYMLSVGLESVSRETLEHVHKFQNRPETYRSLSEKIHSFGLLLFGLFMFGFDTDTPSSFEETVSFAIDAAIDVCAFSILTPYPGTLVWFEMLKQGRIFSFNWDDYDQGHNVFEPQKITSAQLKEGYKKAYREFYSTSSILRRFPYMQSRSKFYWTIYNLFFRKGELDRLTTANTVAQKTDVLKYPAVPPVMPARKDLQDLILMEPNDREGTSLQAGDEETAKKAISDPGHGLAPL